MQMMVSCDSLVTTDLLMCELHYAPNIYSIHAKHLHLLGASYVLFENSQDLDCLKHCVGFEE